MQFHNDISRKDAEIKTLKEQLAAAGGEIKFLEQYRFERPVFGVVPTAA